MTPLAQYIQQLRAVHALGAVPETSYYPALSDLLNAAGQTVSPKVSCVVHPRSQGAGIPDLALYSADQAAAAGSGAAPMSVLPARGVVEAKGAGAALDPIVASPQVAMYLNRYGQVLVTNLREFRLVTRAANGAPEPRDYFALAGSEGELWSGTITADPALFADFLRRVITANAPLTNPKDVAWVLASYARDARARLLGSNLHALDGLRGSLEAALGIAFTDERGDNFFRSTLVQTLFYGIFSAWVLWHQSGVTGRFDWRTAAWYLRVPVVAALFEEVAKPSRLGPLGLTELLDYAGDALARVDRAAFFAQFAADNAVQYFYEPFLEAFDPDLRRELGVWYTPREIVRYQVARVDALLRDELGIAAGLADESVVVLDPCCGTGAYLVEVLRLIHARLTEGGADMLALAGVKRAATGRVFGFEILPAPFVVAHLQLGLLLQSLGVPLAADTGERAGVYLTNALTGWENAPPQGALFFPGLSDERDAADRVKRGGKILVVLGNPPYNGFAGVSVAEERALSNAYRTVKRVPPPQGQGLNDLYVRFFRMAERCVTEGGGGRGIVSFISNYSWLNGLSFTGMRERFADVFDRVWIDNCNGDKYKTGKTTPEGLPDPSVFSTPTNREGIQVGTAIATLVRTGTAGAEPAISYRDFWGKTKLSQIAGAGAADAEPAYRPLAPAVSLGLPFTPRTVEASYLAWHKLPELFPVSFPGIQTSRDDVVVDIDRDQLVARMTAYFDPAVSDEQMKKIAPSAMATGARFSGTAVRAQLIKRGILRDNFVRYTHRPFDTRWLYWEPETNLLDRNRSDYVPHIFPGNAWIAAAQVQRKEYEAPLYLTAHGSRHVIERGANLFPLKLRVAAARLVAGALFADAPENTDGTRYNLSDAARAYLETVGGDPEALFFHTLAVLHSPAYRAENSGALQQDWPRVPLPASAAALAASAALGRRIAALLDTETAVPGVSTPPVRADLLPIARLTHDERSGLAPGDLVVAANWGYRTGTSVMPGSGKTGVQADGTLDVYLNAHVAWRNIPASVWGYTIGGYQVLKKWLSYREMSVLGRALTPEEAGAFQATARRIAALLSLAPELDASYRSLSPP